MKVQLVRNECFCPIEGTCCVSDREESFPANYPGKTAAPVLAGAPQLAADSDTALLETLQHLHCLPLNVLLNVFQLMAEPLGFWRESSPPQQLPECSWKHDELTCSWLGRDF